MMPLKRRVVAMLIISIVAIGLGMAISYFSKPGMLADVFPLGLQLSFIVAGVFSFGFLFFGYLTPLIMFFSGYHFGFVSKFGGDAVSAFLVTGVLASILAAFASIRLGDALLDDMVGKGNFKDALLISMIVLLAAVMIAIVVDLVGIGPRLA